MKSRTIYILLAIGCVVSVVVAAMQPSASLVQGVAAIPAAAAVVAAFFQLLRDQMAHDRALALQAAENTFAVGATSHMACVAFDKHVEFSEAYIAEVFETLTTLFRAGPSAKALPHAANLYGIRQKWALWITTDIEQALEKFEAAVRRIGADSHFVSVDLAHPDRSKIIREVHELFGQVLGRAYSGQPATEEHEIDNVVRALRRVLGVEELTGLRQTFVSRAKANAG